MPDSTKVPVVFEFYFEGEDRKDIAYLHTVPVAGDRVHLPYHAYKTQRYRVLSRELRATEDSQAESWIIFAEAEDNPFPHELLKVQAPLALCAA